MNVHEEWTDQLSEFLDGELSAEERRAVEAHLRDCADCAAVLADLKRVVARAQQAGAVPRPPSVDLWSGIAARIDAGGATASIERSGSDRAPIPFAGRPAEAGTLRRRVAFTLPQLAAAAALVAAVSGGLVWGVVQRAATRAGDHVATAVPAPAAPAADQSTDTLDPADRIVPVGMADAQYDAAVSDLEGALKQGRGRLDAATIGIVEHNLQIIDQAIAQAREALAADPANTYLSGHLVEARRRKLDLLRRAAALTSETD
jgi:anti-sigma factor RsiW